MAVREKIRNWIKENYLESLCVVAPVFIIGLTAIIVGCSTGDGSNPTLIAGGAGLLILDYLFSSREALSSQTKRTTSG